MEINKMLVLSTAHLRHETAKAMDAECELGISYYDKCGCGWFVYTECGEMTSVPADLKECIALASNQECEWICFDCDACEVEGLPVYEW